MSVEEDYEAPGDPEVNPIGDADPEDVVSDLDDDFEEDDDAEGNDLYTDEERTTYVVES